MPEILQFMISLAGMPGFAKQFLLLRDGFKPNFLYKFVLN